MLPSQIPEFAKARYPRGVATIIGKPPGFSDAEIGRLPALVDRSDPRFPAIRSFWRPSQEDLASLNAGGLIELEVIAHQMVPVALNIIRRPLPPQQDNRRERVMVCVLCLYTRERPDRAVTVMAGNAVCDDHMGYFQNEQISLAIARLKEREGSGPVTAIMVSPDPEALLSEEEQPS
jgi:hypothetical protein